MLESNDRLPSRDQTGITVSTQDGYIAAINTPVLSVLIDCHFAFCE
jgi:hypothetical protein